MASQIGEACNTFALRIFSHLTGSDNNVLFSPWNMYSCLAMTFVGARGNTAGQMSKELGLANPDSFAGMLDTLTLLQNVKSVKCANKMWIQLKFDSLPEFQEHLKKYFLSEVGVVDYVKDFEGARVKINSWVEKQTNSKIKNLIPPGVLDPLTRLVLTSAVYFKESWLTEFPKRNTRLMKFHMNSSTTTTVNMMYMNAKKDVMYDEEDNYQVLALPYIGRRLAMNIILPKEKISLDTVINDLELRKIKIDSVIKPTMHPKNIEIYVPRFKFEFAQTYNEILKNLGLTDMFSDTMADFSGITKEVAGLKVTSVIQKAFIEVNEEGTEAAAATAVVLGRNCMMPRTEPPIIFKADRPFIFMIVEKSSNIVLFMGKVINPSQ